MPSLLGLAFALRRGGWPACRALLGKILPQRGSCWLVVIALVLPILAALVARLLGEAFGAQPPPVTPPPSGKAAPPPYSPVTQPVAKGAHTLSRVRRAQRASQKTGRASPDTD